MVEFSYMDSLGVLLPNQYQTVLAEKVKPRKSQQLLLNTSPLTI